MNKILNHRLLYIPIAFLFLLSFTDCARKGNPSGGPKDTIPPKIIRSVPENYNIHFKGDEIEIRFDEYIKLKNINQELVISPPMKYPPVITPLSTSKTMRIKFLDTLQPNTTYTLNFGKSIEDNHEGNVLEYFKYVFSTGSYIDSLTLTGRVRDAQLIAPEVPATVMLYERNESYTDSIIYNQKPTYVTITKDTTGVFEFTNLKEGDYLLIALREKTNDYIFKPKEDKIGFVAHPVRLPTDSVYTLTLFKEVPEFKWARPGLEGKQHIVFGYEGKPEDAEISLISEAPADYESVMYKEETKDTLHYWFKPNIETDTLIFALKSNQKIDTARVRMRDLYRDSLKISAISGGTLKLKENIRLKSTTPLVKVNADRMEVMKKDSTIVEADIFLDKELNRAEISFAKTEEQNYIVRLFPGAITDFFGKENDTIRMSVSTRSSSDYGTLNLTLENVNRYPVIVQLVDDNYKVVAEDYLESPRDVFFDEIAPKKYFLRIIYDDNQNRKWDTGNFLKRIKPEEIIYFPRKIDIRANWSINEIFRLRG